MVDTIHLISTNKMEEKKFTKFEKARIKRTAQNVDQYVQKKNKLVKEVKDKQDEIEQLQKLIDMSDAPVKLMTGGYGVEDLVKKVITPTDKLDKNGNILKTTSYEFKYPDTIIPPVPMVEEVEEIPYAEGMGSDYDADSENLSKPTID